MSDSQNFGFAKLVPGFDFLQNLAKGSTEALPQMPNLSSWVAPTLNIEELEKRIQELRAVHFWLEQNSKALGATIQALEVQKMTLATLEGMNCSMADLAQALNVPPSPAGASQAAQPQPASVDEPASKAPRKAASKSGAKPAQANVGVIDPMQWWGSLTEQFQHIAATAMQEVAPAPAARASKGSAAPAASKPKTSARKAAPRKKPSVRAAARRGG